MAPDPAFWTDSDGCLTCLSPQTYICVATLKGVEEAEVTDCQISKHCDQVSKVEHDLSAVISIMTVRCRIMTASCCIMTVSCRIMTVSCRIMTVSCHIPQSESLLRVKDPLAAVWPFCGIVVEVAARQHWSFHNTAAALEHFKRNYLGSVA